MDKEEDLEGEVGVGVFRHELPGAARVVANRDAEDIALITERDVHLYGLARERQR